MRLFLNLFHFFKLIAAPLPGAARLFSEVPRRLRKTLSSLAGIVFRRSARLCRFSGSIFPFSDSETRFSASVFQFKGGALKNLAFSSTLFGGLSRVSGHLGCFPLFWRLCRMAKRPFMLISRSNRRLSRFQAFLPTVFAVMAFWAFFASIGAQADCQETDITADAAMEDAKERYESRDGFANATETREAWDSCLSGLFGYSMVFGPVLAPLPDLGEVTDRLCRQTRQLVLDKMPLPAPLIRRALSGKAISNSSSLADELARALE